MADESVLPSPPVAFTIPDVLVEKWTKIPESAVVSVPMHRRDIDNLFFAISRITRSNDRLQNCLILYTQGKLEAANAALADAQRANVEGDNYIRMFMSAIMASVSEGVTNG